MTFDVTWLGQGGFIFTVGDKKICIDPYLSNSLKAFNGFDRLVPVPIRPEDLDVDLFLFTHDHIDHLDEQTIRFVKNKDNTQYGGPASCVKHLRELGFADRNLVSLNRGEWFKFGNALLFGVFAEHTPDSVGYLIRFAEHTVYVVGDSLFHKGLTDIRLFQPDVIFCCINGKLGNMDLQQAAFLCKEIGVQTAVPCHYGMFAENTEDPDKFHAALEASSVKFYRMDINSAVTINTLLAK